MKARKDSIWLQLVESGECYSVKSNAQRTRLPKSSFRSGARFQQLYFPQGKCGRTANTGVPGHEYQFKPFSFKSANTVNQALNCEQRKEGRKHSGTPRSLPETMWSWTWTLTKTEWRDDRATKKCWPQQASPFNISSCSGIADLLLSNISKSKCILYSLIYLFALSQIYGDDC